MVNKSVLNNVFRIFSFKFFNVKKLFFLIIILIIAYHSLTLTRFAKKISITDSFDFFPPEETNSLAENNQSNQDNENTQNSENKNDQKETQSSKKLLGVNGCKLIDDEYKQYTVSIDDVTYPQYLYLSQNKSINYDCLNNSTPLKKILAWNKFYGNYLIGTNEYCILKVLFKLFKCIYVLRIF